MSTFKYLAQTCNAWGGGDTIEDAMREMRKAGAARSDEYIVMELSPPSTVQTNPVWGPCVEAGVETTIVKDGRKQAS